MIEPLPEGQQFFNEVGNGRLPYAVVYSRRRTLGIHIYPDLRIVVRAPRRVSPRRIRAFVHERTGWIEKKIAHFQAHPPLPPLLFHHGEQHTYLGNAYTLNIKPSTPAGVTISDKAINIAAGSNPSPPRVERLFNKWNREQAENLFSARLHRCMALFNGKTVRPTRLRLRRMKSRWGSCSSKGAITLNTHLMRVQLPLIDYVITHELCHLIEHNHSARYYELLGNVMPDWRARKKLLNQQRLR